MSKKILIAIVAILIIIQFFGINKTNPVTPAEQDFITIHTPSTSAANTLKAACYDCHSNETKYPWYTSVAPLSWWIKHHIDEGKEHVNYSIWGSYDAKKADHKLEESIEVLEEEKMPLTSYTLAHPEAKLSDAQRTELINYFKSLR